MNASRRRVSKPPSSNMDARYSDRNAPLAVAVAVPSHQSPFEKLNTLKLLLDCGHLTADEYQERKTQIINDMTGTSTERKKPSPRSRRPGSANGNPPPPPLQPLLKTKRTSDKLSFDVDTLEWHSTPVRVKLDLVPFATGQLRNAYYLQELGADDSPSRLLVAKVSLRPAEPSTYLSDVEMQAVCAHYAALYNEHEPPLKNEGHSCAQWRNFYPERLFAFFVRGFDFRLMIVDIQGVADSYTDPQIHSADGRGFGVGNLGTFGMEKFLESHRCNEYQRTVKPGGTAAPGYEMPFGGAIKKSTNRITEERNTFSTSVTVSEAFGDTATADWTEREDSRLESGEEDEEDEEDDEDPGEHSDSTSYATDSPGLYPRYPIPSGQRDFPLLHVVVAA
ncbi:Protein kinase-like domain [Phytophthora cactorum]|nr:Protein kinase-like domain [Phytophthora cactorum]